MKLLGSAILATVLTASCAQKPTKEAPAAATHNNYKQINLVANKPEFKAEFINPQMQNAWGLANRPAGFGGHFWITAQKTGTSIEYVGDVGSTKLYQDELTNVDLHHKKGQLDTPTGVVFNPGKAFVINQISPMGDFKSESKFIFATDSGRLYGWAEKKNSDGTWNRPVLGVLTVDNSKRGDQYFGLGIDPKGEKIYVADFGVKPQMRVFDSNYKEVPLKKDQFKNPFIKGAYSRALEYGPYNAQVLSVNGKDHVFVTYAQINKTKSGKVEAGEEIKGAGLGRVVEYDLDGNLVRVWKDKGLLNAPWGLVTTPENFGRFSNMVLVGNFGDGSIVAFDPKSGEAVDFLKSQGEIIKIDGLWGLMFGNGASLGEKDHLYFAAGPNDEVDGIFGKLRYDGQPSTKKE